jgi:excisionase family DNA binding protein
MSGFGKNGIESTLELMAAFTSNSAQEWLDLKGLTRYAAVSERTLREWIHRSSNPLPASQVGTKLLVKRSTFDRWVEAHAVTPADSVDVNAMAGEILADLAVAH